MKILFNFWPDYTLRWKLCIRKNRLKSFLFWFDLDKIVMWFELSAKYDASRKQSKWNRNINNFQSEKYRYKSCAKCSHQFWMPHSKFWNLEISRHSSVSKLDTSEFLNFNLQNMFTIAIVTSKKQYQAFIFHHLY